MGQQVALADHHAVARFELAEQRHVALLDQYVVARRAGHEAVDSFAKQPAAFKIGRIARGDDCRGTGDICRLAKRLAGGLRDEPAVHGRVSAGTLDESF